jgi:hypothetical protein
MFYNLIKNRTFYICTMKKLQVIQISLEERLMATRPNVYRNKKKYQRKTKHRNNGKL